MFSKIQLAKKYIQYFLRASNGKGHGVHSPFVFDFISKILNDKQSYPCYKTIENIRSELLKNETVLEIEDFGAGSRTHVTNKRSISSIAHAALKPKKYSRLLFRIIQHYQSKNILELGTCLGITTSYLANGNAAAQVFTMEGAQQIAQVANENFEKLSLKNIRLIQGNFDETLPHLVYRFTEENKNLDFVFVDGNHRQEPTLRYFHELLPVLNDYSIVAFDDIHWSEGMENAWNEIIQHPAVTLSIDLFFIGFVFFRKEQKAKQHFTIRF